jgi:hypothetical protein
MLQQNDVSCRQLRGDNPGYLVKGEIPGFDRENDAQWFMKDNGFAFGRICYNQLLRCEKSFRIFHVIFEHAGAYLDFTKRLGRDLAHL